MRGEPQIGPCIAARLVGIYGKSERRRRRRRCAPGTQECIVLCTFSVFFFFKFVLIQKKAKGLDNWGNKQTQWQCMFGFCCFFFFFSLWKEVQPKEEKRE